jgi:hypothetical protein
MLPCRQQQTTRHEGTGRQKRAEAGRKRQVKATSRHRQGQASR